MSGTAVLEEMSKFDASGMKHVEVTEKVALPSVEGNLILLFIWLLCIIRQIKSFCFFLLDIQAEKKHLSLIDGVETFAKDGLKATETKEKIVLPTAEDIENEKKNRD